MSTFGEPERVTQLKYHYKELHDKPNSHMIGNTFDAKHLEKFLQTGYGEKTAYFVPSPDLDPKALTANARINGSQISLTMQSNVRPDPCFLRVPRQLRRDASHGCTLKPFEFVYPKLCVPNSNYTIDKVYKKEIKNVGVLKDKFAKDKLSLDQSDTGMKMHKERLKDVEDTKKNMERYAEFRAAQALATRRGNQIKAGWRNGVVGVDSVLNPSTFFFDEKQKLMVEREFEKYAINEIGRAHV